MIKNDFLLINKVERGLADLSRGMPILFSNNNKKYLIFSAELFSEENFSLIFDKKNNFYNLAITKHKAAKLQIQATENILISVASSEINNIIASNNNANYHRSKISTENIVINYGIALMKELQLLPYIIFEEITSDIPLDFNFIEFDEQIIDQYLQLKKNQNSIKIISSSRIALKNAENSKIIIFSDMPNFGKTHIAIIIGEENHNQTPYVRVHSGCYTGDLLASLQCDCRDQLQNTIKFLNEKWIYESVYGVIVYQAVDEGRAIGLANKIRAYNFQRCNHCNTIDANYEVGYDDDERDFVSAANILKKLKIEKCRLITNNPKKISNLESNGIKIEKKISIIVKANQYNEAYLGVKFNQMDHML